MSFETWWKRSAPATFRAMPWIKGELRTAFLAGQAYEKALTKKRKPKKEQTA